MPYYTGTNDTGSLLAVQNATVGEVGVDAVAAALLADLSAWNTVVLDPRDGFVADIADWTTDRMRSGGIGSSGTMLEVDEYGAAPTHKEMPAGNLGFPLRSFQHNIGWTEKAVLNRTPADLQKVNIGAQVAHRRLILREVQRALFLSANYTFVDKLVDQLSIPVKRLANADGFGIPTGPFGEQFTASTHNHYTAEASLTAAGLAASRNLVIEHGVVGPVKIAISSTNEAAVSALTGFTPLQYSYIVPATSAAAARGPALDETIMNNRQIGYFGPAQVWVKPWAIANYAVTYDSGAAEGRKPVAIRQRSAAAFQGLRLAAQNSAFPLIADFFEAELGAGVQNRVAAAVHFFAGGAYSDPAI